MSDSDLKPALRRAALARRDAIAARTRARAAKAIARRVLALPQWQRARTVAVYMAIGSEVATAGLVTAALAAGKRVAAPVTCWERRDLEFRVISRLADLVPARLGIPEPRAGCPVLPLAEADLVLVPGVAFDRRGYRLGYGAGCYDRALAAASEVCAIGLAFALQVVASLPTDYRDRPVDLVVTEREILDCRAAREQRCG